MKPPPRKTLEQVQRELFLKLYENARKLLEGSSPPHSNNPTIQDLVNVLDTVAKQKFLKNYGYAYQGAQSKPKHPNVKNISSTDGLLNISSDSDPQIVNYIQFLLNNTNVKSQAVLNTSRAQLVDQGRLLFRTPISDAWNALPFDKSYEEPDPTQNPWKADLMMVECNAGLTLDGQGAKYTFIYFIGIYYEMISQDALKAKLFKTLMDNAKKLPGAGPGGTLDVQALQAVLLGATKAQFQIDYQVPYLGNATQPKDLAVGKAGDVRGTSAIYYLPENDPPNIKTFIETNILSAIEFTRNDVQFAAQAAYKGLETQLTNILKNNTGNSWLLSKFSQVYNSPFLNENSLRTITILFYTKASLTEGSVTTKSKFISYLGVYYHIPSPNQKAINTLLDKLYDAASRLYDPPKQFKPPHDTQGFETIMDDWGKFKFQSIYSIEYKGDNTIPKDIINTSYKLASNLSTIVVLDNEWSTIDDTIDIVILLGLDVPDWLLALVKAEIRKAFLAAQKVAVDGSIKSAKFTKTYRDPIFQGGYEWKTLSILTFTNGVLTEGGKTTTRTFLNYIGVLYPVSPLGGPISAARSLSVAAASPHATTSSHDEGFHLL
jgi:hypothetical protein